jgi:hypothetical protein
MHLYIQILNDAVLQVLPTNPLCWQWLQHEFHYLNYVLGGIGASVEVNGIGILLEELFDLFAAYRSISFFTEGQSPKDHLIKRNAKRPYISRVPSLLSLITYVHLRGQIVECPKGCDLVP